MSEKNLEKLLKPKLSDSLKDYNIEVSANLIYRVIINQKGEYFPADPKKAKRGSLAFQTDILIKKNNLPLVVIELKDKRLSTHDIITYSYKAQKHKEIYPYLRYGLVLGGWDIISNKFFNHNSDFDFVVALGKLNNLDSIKELIRIVKGQLKDAESLLKVLEEKNKTRIFNNKLEIIDI